VLADHVYADQEISGEVAERPGYTRLLAAAKAREFEAIIVEAQDRLWRDQGEMHQALRRLRFWDVRVFSVIAGTDLTEKVGSLLASVTGWKDEVFLDDLREKTRRGMLGQVRRGMAAGGRSYGYTSEVVRDAMGQTVGARRIIDPKEAEVVRRIFTLYIRGWPRRASRTC
jgi:DNA invertase Pin-like site-specific DNA recombinase